MRCVLVMQLVFFFAIGGMMDDLSKKTEQNMEVRIVMADLLSHSLKELGEIRAKSI